jgi:hypothetical protein
MVASEARNAVRDELKLVQRAEEGIVKLKPLSTRVQEEQQDAMKESAVAKEEIKENQKNEFREEKKEVKEKIIEEEKKEEQTLPLIHTDEDWRRFKKNVENNASKTVNKIKEEANPKKEDSPALKEEKSRRSAKTGKKGVYINSDKVIEEVVRVLKEKGVPVKSKDLWLEVKDRFEETITQNNFSNNIMYRASHHHPKVERVMRGYFQYKF